MVVCFDSLHPRQQSFSQVFLGWTSSKQRIKHLAQGHNTVPLVRIEPPTPWSQVKHSSAELPSESRWQFSWMARKGVTILDWKALRCDWHWNSINMDTSQYWGRGQKFHSSAHTYEWNLERTSNSSQSTRPIGRVLWKELLEDVIFHITLLCSLLHYAFKGQVHVFAGRVKIVSHSSCRTIFKYFVPLWGHNSTILTWYFNCSKESIKIENSESECIFVFILLFPC